jgi:hypothetical protein
MRKVIILACLIVICIFLGWTYYSKRNDMRIAAQKAEEKAVQDRAFAKAYGENRLTILGFYANPGTIHPGEKAQLCYSVNNAENVRIEPPVKYVWPSLGRCVDVTPRKDTVYKFIAEDASGQTKTATTTVKVF